MNYAVQSLEGMENVTLGTRTMAAGLYDHGYVLAYERVADHTPGDGRPRHRLWRIRAGHVVTATGAIERPLSFAGNDIPGVMLAGAVRDFVVNWAVSPGDRTVIVTNNDDAYRTALALAEAGLIVPAVVDARAKVAGALPDAVRAKGIRVLENEVEAVKPVKALPKLPVARVLWKPMPDMVTGCSAWILAGGAHHTCYSQNLSSEGMQDFAEMAGIEFVLIGKNTNLYQFKNELRWNDASFK